MTGDFCNHIALTGGIGSGKSSAAAYLAKLGWPVVDADLVARELLQADAAGWRALRAALGADYFLADRSLNRPLLRAAIFADPRLRQRVDGLLHPLIRAGLRAQLAGKAPHLVEVPLLYESGWAAEFGRVVVVTAGEECCLRRVLARDGVSREQALAAMAAQLPLAAKAGWADWVIDNSGAWEETCRQLQQLALQLGDK